MHLRQILLHIWVQKDLTGHQWQGSKIHTDTLYSREWRRTGSFPVLLRPPQKGMWRAEGRFLLLSFSSSVRRKTCSCLIHSFSPVRGLSRRLTLSLFSNASPSEKGSHWMSSFTISAAKYG